MIFRQFLHTAPIGASYFSAAVARVNASSSIQSSGDRWAVTLISVSEQEVAWL